MEYYCYQEPRQDLGRKIQLEFWQTHWASLIAFIFLSSNVFAIWMFNGLVFFLTMPCHLIGLRYGSENLQRKIAAWLPTGCSFPMLAFAGLNGNDVPNIMWFIKPKYCVDGAWNEVLAPAAVTYLILIHFILQPGRLHGASRLARSTAIHWCLVIAMSFTLRMLHAASAAGLVEIDTMRVYFKTAALATLIFAGFFFDPNLTAALATRFRCADHVSPGLTPRRSLILIAHFFIFLLPLALGSVWLLMNWEIASNDTITATIDRLLPSFCLAFLISHISEAVRN